MDVKYMTVSGFNVSESVCQHQHTHTIITIKMVGFFLYFVLYCVPSWEQGFLGRYMETCSDNRAVDQVLITFKLSTWRLSVITAAVAVKNLCVNET